MSLLGSAGYPLQRAVGLPRRVANRCAGPACPVWLAGLGLAGGDAAVHDCADFSNAGVQDARTGQVVGSLGSPHVNLISTLVFLHGRWLVSNQVPVVLSCVP